MTVQHAISFKAQSRSDLCWAASIAMVMQTRGRHLTDTDVAAEAALVNEDGVTQIELENVCRHFGLDRIQNASRDVYHWEHLLQSGPVVCAVSAGSDLSGAHIVVVSGAASLPEGGGHIYVLDPWFGEGWLPYEDFLGKYNHRQEQWERTTFQ
jgi:ABC-type bacteriocin/lantibiotic exporter with double-glycine peptidase domain